MFLLYGKYHVFSNICINSCEKNTLDDHIVYVLSCLETNLLTPFIKLILHARFNNTAAYNGRRYTTTESLQWFYRYYTVTLPRMNRMNFRVESL